MPVKRYHLTTFGCQMNAHDSERMKGMLESLGYTEAPERGEADLILFNTCSIRETADSRFIAHLGEAKRLKSEQPERVVGVGGCWAQSVKEEVFERFPFVDVAFGPGQVHKLAEFLTSDSLSAQGYFEFEGFTGHLPARRARAFQGWLQISVGCNCACSYCIVPSTRGREVSRPLNELLAEARTMASEGVREVTLLGQNVNSYGRDLRPERATFAQLLGEVDEIEGIERIRYTSPHPKDMREDVIRAHAELESVCEHIHLPLQSGSSRILKAMRRTYDRERYLDRVALIREHVPDAALSTDIIVGFPGETEEDFAQTLEIVEKVRYDGAFTFVFSPRRGTVAGGITEGIVPHPVKVERMGRLVEAVKRNAHERAQRFVGRTLEVLVEGPSRTDPERTARQDSSQQGRQLRWTGGAGRVDTGPHRLRHESDALGRGVIARPRRRLTGRGHPPRTRASSDGPARVRNRPHPRRYARSVAVTGRSRSVEAPEDHWRPRWAPRTGRCCRSPNQNASPCSGTDHVCRSRPIWTGSQTGPALGGMALPAGWCSAWTWCRSSRSHRYFRWERPRRRLCRRPRPRSRAHRRPSWRLVVSIRASVKPPGGWNERTACVRVIVQPGAKRTRRRG